MTRCLGAIAGLASLVLGCGAATPAAPKIGVFADTGSLKELTAYVSEKPVQTFSARTVADVPSAAGVRCFYVTVPRIDIMRSKAYMVPESGEISLDTPSLETEIDDFGNDVFKLTVPGFRGKTGLAGLMIKMPPGTPDRLYLVRLE